MTSVLQSGTEVFPTSMISPLKSYPQENNAGSNEGK